jgi:hypothetical protein
MTPAADFFLLALLVDLTREAGFPKKPDRLYTLVSIESGFYNTRDWVFKSD